MQLRPYQLGAIIALRGAILAKHLRLRLCSPTGSGKTRTLINAIFKAVAGTGTRVVYALPNLETIGQVCKLLRQHFEDRRLAPDVRVVYAVDLARTLRDLDLGIDEDRMSLTSRTFASVGVDPCRTELNHAVLFRVGPGRLNVDDQPSHRLPPSVPTSSGGSATMSSPSGHELQLSPQSGRLPLYPRTLMQI